jgi:exodeoxyribonuclease V beta subunit
MLAAKHEQTRRANSFKQNNQYDDFVFRELKKGAVTGNLLHQVLENIRFDNSTNWLNEIKRSVLRYAPQQKDLYETMLQQMMTEVLHAPVPLDSSFKMSDIASDNKITEFEFDFPVDPFLATEIEQLSDEKMQISVKSAGELEGIMNGKIDLFFEYQGKYYILDWKSNYLGDSLESYSTESVAEAMNENNYHLQYLIYTVALKKYLESRLEFEYERDFGGVIYMFLRGVRKDGNTGMFTTKPSLEKINILQKMMQRAQEEKMERA